MYYLVEVYFLGYDGDYVIHGVWWGGIEVDIVAV